MSLSQLVRNVLGRELADDDDSSLGDELETGPMPVFPVPGDLGQMVRELDPSWRADWRRS
jgi:hypothetical protein